MITATTVVGIDVSRDWLDGFCFPGERMFRLANSAEGYEMLVAAIREIPGPVKVRFEATSGQEWTAYHVTRPTLNQHNVRQGTGLRWCQSASNRDP